MTEREQNISPAALSNAAPPSKETPSKDEGLSGSEDKRPITAAERKFDAVVYGGIGWAATFLFSVWLGDWVKEGGGKAKFEQAAKWLGKRLARGDTQAELQKATEKANQYLVTTALFGAGLPFLFPIKHLEDNKAAIVRSMHEKSVRAEEAKGNAPSEEQRITDEASLKLLDKTPQQTWGSIIIGRLVGTAAVYGAVAVAGDKMFNTLGNGGADAAASVLKRTSSPFLRRMANHPRFKRIVNMSILEALMTAICTSGLYVYTHAVCPPKQAPATTDNATETSHELAQPTPSFADKIEPKKPFVAETRKTDTFVTRTQKPAESDASASLAV